MPDTASLPLCYLNGRVLPRADAALSVDDRGTLFGDGVYEVVRLYAGRLFEADAHVARLRDSLQGIRLPPPPVVDALPEITLDLARRMGWRDAKAYWQITRGPMPRRQHAPLAIAGDGPSVLVTLDEEPPVNPDAPVPTCSAILTPDERWGRPWIKSLMLLPNAMARDEAFEKGCQEAIMFRDGLITEGAATGVFIVADGILKTRPLDGSILPSVTRRVLLEMARSMNIDAEESAYTPAELLSADEVFLCGTTTHVTAVVRVDDRPIGDGGSGAVTQRLHRGLLDAVMR